MRFMPSQFDDPVESSVERFTPQSRNKTRRRALYPVSLPGDELALGYPVEWWYFAGQVRVPTANTTLGIFATFIRGQRAPLPAQCASFLKLTNVATGPAEALQGFGSFDDAYWYEQSPIRFLLKTESRPPWLFTTSGDRWMLGGRPGHYRFTFDGRLNGVSALDLRMQAQSSAMLFGGPNAAGELTGIVDYGMGHALAWYVRPQLSFEGEITLAGQQHAVEGDGWFERQWGTWTHYEHGWKYLSFELPGCGHVSVYSTFVDAVETRIAEVMWIGETEPEHIVLQPHEIDNVPRPNAKSVSATQVEFQTSRGQLAAEIRPIWSEPPINPHGPTLPSFHEDYSKVEGTFAGRHFESYGMTEASNHV